MIKENKMEKTRLLAKKGFKKLTLEEVKEKQLKRQLQKNPKLVGYSTHGIGLGYWGKLSLGKPKTKPKSNLKRGSMVKPIPLKMREELAEDPFMKKCCLKGVGNSNECEGEIQWHHNLIYAGKRINEKGAILPLCKFHHEKESKHKFLLNAIMNNRMTDEDRAKYPKKKWL